MKLPLKIECANELLGIIYIYIKCGLFVPWKNRLESGHLAVPTAFSWNTGHLLISWACPTKFRMVGNPSMAGMNL